MKTIVAGSRSITDQLTVYDAISSVPWVITEIVSGGARGVDKLGEGWANLFGVPCLVFSADWTKHGKSAGPIRNGEMAEYSDALVAIWDGKSCGTRDMIERALLGGLNVLVLGRKP